MSLTENELKKIINSPVVLANISRAIFSYQSKIERPQVLEAINIIPDLIFYRNQNRTSSSYYSGRSLTGINGRMTISDEGLRNIRNHEGLRLKAYQDAVSKSTYNIGYGHQIKKGEEYLLNATITKEQAEMIFQADVRSFEPYLKKDVKVKLRQGQFDALVDMYYQFGPGGIKGTGLIDYLNKNGITNNPDIDLNVFNKYISKYPTRKDAHWKLWRQ